MESLTDQIIERYEMYKEELDSSQPTFFAKLYNPVGTEVWYPMSYDEKSNTCYGLVTAIGYKNYEHFSLSKLENLNLPYQSKVQCDELFDIMTLENMLSFQDKVFNTLKQEQTSPALLPERLFYPPKEIKGITEKNVFSFLRDQYQIQQETELYVLSKDKYKEVVFDLYRNFTGATPLNGHLGGISIRYPQDSRIKSQYEHFPEFSEDADLGFHIRDMRAVKKHIKKVFKEMTSQRIKELKKIAKNQDQELEH